MHDAALPGRAGEHLPDGAPQARVGVRGDAAHAGDAPLAQREQEGPPRGVVLGVGGVHAQEDPVAGVGGPDGGDHGATGDVAAVAALEVGGVYPEIGEARAAEGPPLQVGHGGVQGLADAGHLAGAHAVDPQRAGHLLHLAGGHPAGDHLGHRGHHGAVDSAVALDEVLGEVGPPPELRDAQRDAPDAGEEPALPVAVALVALGAGVLGLRVHDLVDDRLGEGPDELVDVDHAVVESGNLGRIGADCC